MRWGKIATGILVVALVAVGLTRVGDEPGSSFRPLLPAGADAVGAGSSSSNGISTRVRLEGAYAGDVRRLPILPVRPRPEGEEGEPGAPPPALVQPSSPTLGQTDAVTVAAMPATDRSFDGVAYNYAGTPPDPAGDVGPNHYVEAVNTKIGIYAKTGTELATFTFNELWANVDTTTACKGFNYGDPTVVYDPIGDRWIIADFAFADQVNFTAPYYECIAVSQGPNPVSDGWYFYSVLSTDAFPDYPKMGIWPDALYLTANMFTSRYKSARAWAINRADLESGVVSPRVVMKDLGSRYFSLLPANLRGATPPTNSPAYLVSQDWNAYRFDVWKWRIDWAAMTSTFSGPTQISQTTYQLPNGEIVPQKDSPQLLDALDFRLMMQAQYRNIGGTESIWVAHTVGNGPTGVHWAQLSVTGGTVSTTPVQQGIWTGGGDGLYRWIPSLAVDRNGNMAMAYSVSSSTLFPEIRAIGRLASDASGTLGQSETTLFSGPGSQINIGRWGDYFAMSVDPVDDCTFWYVGEYVSATEITLPNGSVRHPWRTRIMSFKYPSCAPAATRTVALAKSSVQSGVGTVTSSPSGISCATGCTSTSATFLDGTVVTLTASAPSGSVFTGWSGVSGCSTSSTCTFTVSADVSATAQFTGTRTLTVTKVNGTYGTVTSSPSGISCGSTCSFAYAYNTTVVLTATPGRKRTFTGWSGDCASTTATTCTVTMTAARSVTATFA